MTRTYTGPCAINTPIAVCEFEVPSEDIPSGPPALGSSGKEDDRGSNVVQAAGPSRTGSGGVPRATGNGVVSARSGGKMNVAVGIAVGVGLMFGVQVG